MVARILFFSPNRTSVVDQIVIRTMEVTVQNNLVRRRKNEK
jgi:hypothetical protein